MKNMAQNDQVLWVAILGDQIDSRTDDRRDLDLVAIEQRIKEINELCGDRLKVPFSMSHGDEIQALVSDPVTALDVIDTFDSNSWLISFRYTLGIGGLSTDFGQQTWSMDGPCFHNARDAMEHAKKEKRWLTVHGLDPLQDEIVNGVARSLQVIRQGWTRRQKLAYSIRRLEDQQQIAAELMDMDQSTLSKMLKAAHYKPYLEIESTLKTLFREYWKGDAS